VPALAIVLVLLAAAGCARPKTDLDVGVRDVPTNVILGAQTKPPIIRHLAPLPPLDLGIAGPSVITLIEDITEPARPRASTTTTAPPVACPAADPRSPVALAAVAIPDRPPAAATYAFRNDGFFEQSGADAKKGLLPKPSTRTVGNVRAAGPDFTFDVGVAHGGVTTTTSYRSQSAPTAASQASDAGLYMVKIVTVDASGATSAFDPTPDLRLLPYPAQPGVVWRASGFDPVANVGMAYTGTLGNRVRVDACGAFVDAWAVRLDGAVGEHPCPIVEGSDPTTLCQDIEPGGQQVSPSARTTFRAEYGFATQYGGLAVTDKVNVATGDAVSATRYSRNEAIIDRVPEGG
jgi:hypothetical protein